MSQRFMKARAVLAAALVVCGVRAAAAVETTGFTAALSAGQEVPPNSSAATGSGFVILNAAETQITVSLSFSGLTTAAVAGHIHGPAGSGVNAGVLFDLAPPAATSGSVGPLTFAVTATQVGQLKAGLFYFNVHTGTNPGGEIRGQIGSALTYSAQLTGSQEVPPNTSVATGTGRVFLDPGKTQIAAIVDFAGLTTAATAGHIHGPAAVGANALILFDLAPPAATSGSVGPLTFAVTPSQVSDLEGGLHYFNIHSSTFTGGEIRGQLRLHSPAGAMGYTATLSGAQEVPANASAATGTGFVILNSAEDQIVVFLSFSGMSAVATAGHIHGPAAVGVNVPFLFDLAPPAATSGSIGPVTFPITPTQVAQLKSGLFYFNIHSGTFPNGEIRGQIGPALTYGADLSGGQEVPLKSSTATGTGRAFLDPSQTQIAASLDFAGLSGNATAGHIHGPAAPGVNAGVLFDLGPPAGTSGSVAKTFAITPTQVGQLLNQLFYFNIHTPANPAGEIRGQIVPLVTFNGSLSGASEVPPVATTATGFGTVALDFSQTQIAVGLSFAGLSGNATAGHIHGPAVVGVNGPILFDLNPPAATSGSVGPLTFALNATQVGQLRSRLYYFNVHTSANSGGEIRGQIFPPGFFSVTPCRVADTRIQAAGGPSLGAGETRVFTIAGACGIPADAGSVAINVTVVNPALVGFVTVFPTGKPRPTTSTINFEAGQVRANNAVVGLGVANPGDPPAISVFAGIATGQLDFIIDVVGYFR